MEIREKFWKTVTVMFTASLLLLAAPTSGAAASATFTIIQPGDAQAQTGKTYSEWSAAWWQYALEIPLDNNPGLDETGANCNFGQAGAVFFLTSTFGGSAIRNECRVPAGKILFFPLLDTATFRLRQEPEHSLRNYLGSFIRSTRELQASIDGTDVGAMVSLEPRLTPLRAVSPDGFFPVIAPENSIFGGVPGQSYDWVADGFYLMVAPLSPGVHTVKFGGISRNFAADVTYNLIVEP